MIEFHTLTGYGQLAVGDFILLRDNKNIVFPAEVKDVIHPGTSEEEILIGKAKNLYFIVSMYLGGKSWIKECIKVEGGKIYSLSNTTSSYGA